jgi:hypothetical protein
MRRLLQALKMAPAPTDGSSAVRAMEVDVALRIMCAEQAALLQSVVFRTSQSNNRAVPKR